MKQEHLTNDAWHRTSEIAMRHNRLVEHFQTFAAGALSLPKAGHLPANSIQVVPGADPAYFDVTFAGRTFRFRFTSRVAPGALVADGHITMTEIDPLTKREVPKPIDSFSFDGEGRLIGLNAPQSDDPIRINVDAGRYLVVQAVHNAIMQPA